MVALLPLLPLIVIGDAVFVVVVPVDGVIVAVVVAAAVDASFAAGLAAANVG